MRALQTIVLAIYLAVLAPTAVGQSPTSPAQPVVAMSVLQEALRAMGVSQALGTTDTVVLASVRRDNADGNTQDSSVTIKTKGPDRFRLEGNGPKQHPMVVSPQAAVTDKQGNKWGLNDPNARYKRPDHLPGLLLAYELQRNDVVAEYLGTEDVHGRSAFRIAISRVFMAGDRVDDQSTKNSRIDVFVDAQTFTILKIRQTLISFISSRQGALIDTFYEDYRNINGMLVPFRQTISVGERKIAERILQSFVLDAGLDDSEFEVR